MKVTITEIMVDSSNEFIGIVKEDTCVELITGQTVNFDEDCQIHSIDIVDGGIVIYYTDNNDNEDATHHTIK